ncbi:methyltransferase domain-containing protein [Longimycelium tulufanense]|uniref:methyltransferase domain-containing protein n=1 Tax=Longimycelium tulufanense TaxID=907463 RepID=UPI001668FE7D|nr:methyltransferase domain-containing protein [Longimycelium tulufanense]
MDSVGRDRFLPAHVWVDNGRGEPVPVSRYTEPHRWAEVADADVTVLLQFDDGAVRWPEIGRERTATSPAPSVVVALLDALRVEEGHRVLEIGTGTGYTAAVLAHGLGPSRVTTVEIDHFLAATARGALASHGYLVTVAAADGTAGHPPRAPYDRVLSSAAVAVGALPFAWVTQTRPGGRIVAPVRTSFTDGAALVAFAVDEGGRATGRALGRIVLPPLRQHREPLADLGDVVPDDPDAVVSHTTLKLWRVAKRFDARWAIGVQVPGCQWRHEPPDAEHPEHLLWLLDPGSRSWANVRYGTTRGPHVVRQCGPRRLWDEVVTAYRWWKAQGKPGLHRWVLSVTPTGQQVRLEDETSEEG